MNQQHQQLEAVKNYATGILGVTISLADVTSFFQSVGIIAGSLLVCIQLYRSIYKKK